jgi:hypothetical protein
MAYCEILRLISGDDLVVWCGGQLGWMLLFNLRHV